MEVGASEWNGVTERLEKLERQNRRMKQAGAFVFIMAAAAVLMGQGDCPEFR